MPLRNYFGPTELAGFSILTLSGAQELVMDATYGTNSAGMDLFAVLAELDGTGVPLCYMFVQKGDPNRKAYKLEYDS